MCIMQNTAQGRPLLSFCLMCYNQEQYIEDAVHAALNQTYEPLEVIVSDDCSADHTWEILQRLKAEYKGNKIFTIHRNEHNIGIISNLCCCFRMAHAELIVKADGDDISEPERVERMYKAWLESGKEAWCICSSYSLIDVNGRFFGAKDVPFEGEDRRSIADISVGNGYFYLGAASAYRREIIDRFPLLKYPDACDDSVFTIRAAMFGKLWTAKERLVRYRIGSGVTTNRASYRKTIARGVRYCVVSPKQLLEDIEQVRSELPEDRLEAFRESLTQFMHKNEQVLLLYTGRTFAERRKGFRAAYCGGFFTRYGLICHILLLPPVIGDFLLNGLLRIQKMLRNGWFQIFSLVDQK